MDDYNVNVLSEAKNEYSSRLVTILTPLIIEGVKSIFNEACKLCDDNDENDKYLMTFQNFLSRVPKWNTSVIDDETKRIVSLSKCNYLDDLITCVHITQLKILTSIRVSQKQKKIDIDIPKLNDFIHKCYIQYARKLYSNVYLFEKDILPLSYQKNMREAEILCQESILQVIRDGMPVEKILRAYIDETVDEEIIEETVEKLVEQNKENMETINAESDSVNEEEMNTVKKPELEKNNDNAIITKVENKNSSNENNNDSANKNDNMSDNTGDTQQNINLVIKTPVPEIKDVKENFTSSISTVPKKPDINVNDMQKAVNSLAKPSGLKFNDNDSVLDLGTNESSQVNAPKTIERLEKISHEQNEKRKLEEAEDDDDDDDEKLVIHGSSDLKLDSLDIHSLDKNLSTQPDPILDDIEVLA